MLTREHFIKLRKCFHLKVHFQFFTEMVKPGLIYKHLCHSLINSFTGGLFVKISSKHLHPKTVGARELALWDKVYLPTPVTCVTRHVSHITFYMSCVTCHMLHVICLFLSFFSKCLVDGGSGINVSTRLVFLSFQKQLLLQYKIKPNQNN